MKLLLASLALFTVLPAEPNVYPARVQIVEAHHDGLLRGHGYGNVHEPNQSPRGFDYVYTGCRDFEPTRGDERYVARWRSAQQLVIVTQPIGDPKTVECIMRTSLHSYAYIETKDGRLGTVPVGAKNAPKQ